MDTLPGLCLLLLLGVCSLALAVDKTVPPEDIDGSGDDEDYSGGSGGEIDGIVVDSDSKGVTSTSFSTLVPTVEGSTAAQEPDLVAKEETEIEETTQSTETTQPNNDIIDDLFAVEHVPEEAAKPEATTSPVQSTSTADLPEEIDTKKHHHHHHHHHPHHHTTTTSSTSASSESDIDEDDTADLPPTTGVPDKESELHHIPQERTTPGENLVVPGVVQEETTSGSTSTDADDDVTVGPLDVGNPPAEDHLVTTPAAEETPTTKDHHHHHHHHHHPHHTTTSSFVESDVQPEVTTRTSDQIEQDDGEPTPAIVEDEHPHHGHPHPTPSTTRSTEMEEPHEAHTHKPEGRIVHVPGVESTTAVPVISDDEHIPEDVEKDFFGSSTVHYNVSRNPFDENDDSLDSREEESSGVADEDIFFEATVPVINKGRMIPPNTATEDEGSSDASHGIMERKEILAGIIAGGVAGLAFAAALVAFVLYRMKKKDEGSYSLEEPKQSNGGYQKPREQREFYA
ncbi:syndecan-1 [Leptodactylus fuscus]|uniref:syndecan-1 n=1 Tax=Leptodactylus fuscus TaxID=238119 RepID=UPI003F4ED70F